MPSYDTSKELVSKPAANSGEAFGGRKCDLIPLNNSIVWSRLSSCSPWMVSMNKGSSLKPSIVERTPSNFFKTLAWCFFKSVFL